MMYYNESENDCVKREPHLNVSGTGISKILPDLFTVSFTVSYEDSDDDAVFLKVTKDAEKLMKALNSWALPSDRVEGTSFSLYHYRYEKKNGYWRYGQSIACGSVSVSVSSSRIDEASLLLKLGKKNGATDVSSVHYMLSDDLKRRQSEIALVNAVNAAKTDAEVAAKSFGFSLTSILLVDVRNYAENVSYDEDDAYCDDSCFHKLENNFESFHSKPQGFLKAGYIETRVSVDAVYAIGKL